jgi:hypothetical protein
MTRRKQALALALVLAAAPAAGRAQEARPPYERSVVGLNVTYQLWDDDRPWAKKKPENRRAYGIVVAEGKLLTSAEMLSHATFVQVESLGRARQGQPKIHRLDTTVNLALLSLDDVQVSELQPAPVAGRTPTSGTLRTVRWRGQQLEAAASRVIRIEVERSATSLTQHAFLRLRTDMAGGGWSEPIFHGNELVGLAVSQSADESRAIPAEILSAFLQRSAAANEPHGFTTLGANWQSNRDKAVARYLGKDGEPRGILIRQIPWGSSGCGVLEPRDILLEIDGEPLDAEGYYTHPWLGRLGFNHIFAERLPPGKPVRIRVHRDGREQEVTLTARPYPDALNIIPLHQDAPPPYLIAGGLVIRELDVPYLRTWGKEWSKDAPDRLLSRYYFRGEAQTPGRRRVVLINSVLPAPFNIGYHGLRDAVIDRVNGRPIGRIEDVEAALETPVRGAHVIDLARESLIGQIVLDAGTMEQATAAILGDYGIPSARRDRAAPLPLHEGECPDDY